MSKKEEITKDLNRLKSISVLKETDGGKILINSCKQDVLNTIDTIRFKYTELSHIELIGQCARLNERLAFLLTLRGVEENKKIAEQDLEELLKEDEPE